MRFRFSGKLARLLGRESVSSDTAALFELVKNGYDADASRVTVTFENLVANDGKSARITVEDNGEGMTRDDIVNKWMVVGTYSKDRKTTTRMGRKVVGNKGVGRFATEKLAGRATVLSRPQESSEEIRLDIDWTKFEGAEVQFSDVEIPIETKADRPEPDRHGLKIILTDLRERWDTAKIRRLRAAVSSIILPKELQRSGAGFTVEIHSEFEEATLPQVESLLFEKAPYSLSAVLPDGRSGTTVQIRKRGSLIETRTVECGGELNNGDQWQPFGGCDVQVYVYPHDTYYERWSKYYNLLKLSHVNRTVREHCGLKIYRDGFWVSPYGGPGNDWLELDAARVQSNLKAGNTQIIGFVRITKEKNAEIRDTTSRERLEENTAFESLKHFLRMVFDEFYQFRKQEAKAQKERSPRMHEQTIRSAFGRLAVAVNENNRIDKETKKDLLDSIKQLRGVVKSYRRQSVSDYTELEEQQRMYRSLAALGISSAASYHEIFNIVATMGETSEAVQIKLAGSNAADRDLRGFADTLDKKIKMIADYAWFVRKFVQGIGSAVEEPKKEQIRLKDEMEDLWNDYAGLADLDVKFTLDCYPEDLEITINLADFLSLVLNMTTNALKALDGQGQSEKIIRVTARIHEESLEMTFSDNGVGIDDAIREKIFRPLFSTYANGTGMGLSIVSEILDNYGGGITHQAESELDGGATFVLRIPWASIKNE